MPDATEHACDSEVRPVYAITSVAAFWSARRSWMDAVARCATVLVALLDFAPTAAKQIAEPWDH